MNPIDLINKYYPDDSELKHILITHSRSVTDKALDMARRHPELELDLARHRNLPDRRERNILLRYTPLHLSRLFRFGTPESRRISATRFGLRTTYGRRYFTTTY